MKGKRFFKGGQQDLHTELFKRCLRSVDRFLRDLIFPAKLLQTGVEANKVEIL